jgi:AraC family transcriptional activator of pobA
MDRCGAILFRSNMQQTAAPPIPSFGLYGEGGLLPDVLHIETIAVRSALHGWNIRPHRHAALHQILLLSGGAAELSLETERREIAAATVVNVPPRTVHGYRFAAGSEGYVLTVPAELLAGSLDACPPLGLPATGAADGRLTALFAEAAAEHAGVARARTHNLLALAALLAGRTADALGAGSPASRPPLVARFERLLDAHHRERWSVADYAAALGVTSTHLTRTCRAATGLPASRLAEARLVAEAKRLLAYTPHTVAAIAAELGFLDPAHFTRVFTRATSLSPTAFRARLSGGGRTVGRPPR